MAGSPRTARWSADGTNVDDWVGRLVAVFRRQRGLRLFVGIELGLIALAATMYLTAPPFDPTVASRGTAPQYVWGALFSSWAIALALLAAIVGLVDRSPRVRAVLRR